MLSIVTFRMRTTNMATGTRHLLTQNVTHCAPHTTSRKAWLQSGARVLRDPETCQSIWPKKLTRDKTVKCQTGTCRVRPDSSIYTALKPLTTTHSYRKLSANKFINHSANRKMNTRKDTITGCMYTRWHVCTSRINHELIHNQAQQSSRVGVHEEGTCK